MYFLNNWVTVKWLWEILWCQKHSSHGIFPFTYIFSYILNTYLSSYFPEITGSGSCGLKLFLQFCSLIIAFTQHFSTLDLGMRLLGEKLAHKRKKGDTKITKTKGKWQMENCSAILMVVAKEKSILCSPMCENAGF